MNPLAGALMFGAGCVLSLGLWAFIELVARGLHQARVDMREANALIRSRDITGHTQKGNR
jgi:hypothetical protein